LARRAIPHGKARQGKGNCFDQRVVRFCIAKKDETLHAALQRLQAL
jgi:hypothetical protein